MSDLVVERTLVFARESKGRKVGKEKTVPPQAKVPRIAKLMALAIHFDELIRSGKVRDQAEIARLGGVSRARVTQIMDLLNLSPRIQEELLESPTYFDGRIQISLKTMQKIAFEPNWESQGKSFSKVKRPSCI